jgi:pimeloyl-ACP methyl ester carboxylesterase
MRAIEHLARCVAVDLRGHGDSDWASPSSYNIDTHVSDVNEVMNLLGDERSILIGHSMGAQILMRVAAARPTRVRALVLVDFGPDRNAEARLWMLKLLRASLKSYESVAEFAHWLGTTRPLVPPDLLEHLALQSLRPVEGGYRLKLDPALVESMDASSPQHDELLGKIIRDIACPVLVVRGGGSAILSRQAAERMTAALPNGRLVTVAAGHAVMMDNPQGFVQEQTQPGP